MFLFNKINVVIIMNPSRETNYDMRELPFVHYAN